MSSPRVQRWTRVSDSEEILIPEKNILYVKANADDATNIDVVYLINGLRKTSEVFDKNINAISTENLISVTIDGVTNLINGGRVEFVGDKAGAAIVRYDDRSSSLKAVTLGETVQQVKDKMDALVSLANTVS